MADALFTRTQQRVLSRLFCFPDREYYVSELIELAGVGSGTVQRELQRLVASELVTTTLIGKRRFYQANRRSPIFQELHGLFVKTTGLVDPIRQALAALTPRIKRAFIYGSIAKGTAHATSDIDLMIVGDDVTFEDVFETLQAAEHRVGRKIHPTLYREAEFQMRVRDQNPFVMNVLAGDRIDIIGDAGGASSPR